MRNARGGKLNFEDLERKFFQEEIETGNEGTDSQKMFIPSPNTRKMNWLVRLFQAYKKNIVIIGPTQAGKTRFM